MRSLDTASSIAQVSTMLTLDERSRVDAAGVGLYHAIHRDSVDDVLRDLKTHRARAVLLSAMRCGAYEAARVAMVVREFPRVPAVALVSEGAPCVAETVLAFGRSGVRSVVDVREPRGWRVLRTLLLENRAGGIDASAARRLAGDLLGAPDDCRQFFEALFQCPPRLHTIRALARLLGVVPSTLMSRFYRSRLPAPKRYLAMARLARAARSFENPGASVASVAMELDYSSAQSFNRHVRSMLALGAADFRRRYDGEGMIERFRDELVVPHLATLRHFHPLTMPPGWMRDG